MASILRNNALTTLARIRAILALETGKTTNDTIIESFINGVSTFIETYCGRKLISATYTEKITPNSCNDVYLFLKQVPVTALTSVKYRAGTPSVPSYTAYTADDYELEGDGSEGMVRMYASMPSGSNSVQVQYTAGYLIDFSNVDDEVKHTLPPDITMVAEKLIIKAYKKRTSAGVASETGGSGDNISWQKEMDDEDKIILDKYRRLSLF